MFSGMVDFFQPLIKTKVFREKTHFKIEVDKKTSRV